MNYLRLQWTSGAPARRSADIAARPPALHSFRVAMRFRLEIRPSPGPGCGAIRGSARCPAGRGEISEAYVMGRLPEAQADAFERHLPACSVCRAAVEEAREFLHAIREAARALFAERKGLED